jgi:hypothetical protein
MEWAKTRQRVFQDRTMSVRSEPVKAGNPSLERKKMAEKTDPNRHDCQITPSYQMGYLGTLQVPVVVAVLPATSVAVAVIV